ncbi:hypothetical protein T484DRAFT_1910560 [Baffinella frigidus]|nr:hypothetical protein T484DRAFT_1910560 [Cryptophyta sp. CCMP2293]
MSYDGSENSTRRLKLVKALLEDFNNRWGDGTNICTEMEGLRRQPRGFVHTQVVAMALDPRFRDPKGVPHLEHEEVWRLVESMLVNLIKGQLEASNAAAGAAAPQKARNLAPDDPDYDSGDGVVEAVGVKPWRRAGVSAEEAAVTKLQRPKRTDPENLSLLLFLHNGWDLARELELLKL